MFSAQRRDTHVESGPFRGGVIAVCLLAFVATAAAVWWWGPRPARQPSNYSAAAMVIGPAEVVIGPSVAGPEGAEQLEAKILSDETLGQLKAGQISWNASVSQNAAIDDPLELLRQAIDVDVLQSPTADQIAITVSYRGEDPSDVMSVANQLATIVADEHRQAITAASQQAWQEADRAAVQARENMGAARSVLNDFLTSYFQEQQALAEKAAAEAASRKMKAAEQPAPRQTVANPEWIDLDRTRRELIAQREQLLETRTLQHPLVRELESKIQRAEQSMAEVPREIPAEASSVIAHPLLDAPPMQPPADMVVDSESTPHVPDLSDLEMIERGPCAEKYHELSAQAEKAQQAYDRAAEAERVAAENCLQPPNVEVRLAQKCQANVPNSNSSRLLLIALLSGVVLAGGAGLISTGLTADVPLRSVAEAQATLPSPIIGVIPDEMGGGADRRSSGSRLTPTVWGVLLVAICLISLVVYMS